MSALVFAAWIAATVARLAAALRRLADSLAPLTEEAPRQASAPPPEPAPSRAAPDPILPAFYRSAAAAVRARAEGHYSGAARTALLDCARRDPEAAEGLIAHVELLDHYTPGQLRALADDLDRCARLTESSAPAAVEPPAPDHAAETAADVADPRGLVRACVSAEGVDPMPGWPTVPQARAYLASMLPVLPEPLRARVERYRAAPAIKLHYVRSYREALCGAAYPGSRCTGDPQRWHAEPPATRCPTCAAELRRADPHRFDTRLQGITDTSGDADELLSREPPFAGRGGSL